MTLALGIPEELVEAIAQRAADLVLEQLEHATAGPEFLTPGEAADLLRSSRQRVYDLLSSGLLRRYKDGSRVLVRRSEVLAYLGVESALPGGDRRRTLRIVQGR